MFELIKNIRERRELLAVLLSREFNSRYRQSLLGLSWAIIQPITLTFLIVGLRSIFLGAEDLAAESVATFSAVLPWTFFSNAVIFATGSVYRNGDMLKKIYFPRESLVLSSTLASLVDFFVAFLGLLVLMLITGSRIGATMLYMPALLAVTLTLAFAIGLFTSAVTVYKRDIFFGMPFIMQFWMFASPVLYKFEDVPERWRSIYMLNPMAGLITGFRYSVAGGVPPSPVPLLLATVISFAALIVFYRLFKRLEMSFADVV